MNELWNTAVILLADPGISGNRKMTRSLFRQDEERGHECHK